MSNRSAALHDPRQKVGWARLRLRALVRPGLTLSLLLWSLAGAAQTGVNINGPIPWIDVTTYGALGDAKQNLTGNMATAGTTTLTLINDSASGFSLGDVGKAISVNILTAKAGSKRSTSRPTSPNSRCNWPSGKTGSRW